MLLFLKQNWVLGTRDVKASAPGRMKVYGTALKVVRIRVELKNSPSGSQFLTFSKGRIKGEQIAVLQSRHFSLSLQQLVLSKSENDT